MVAAEANVNTPSTMDGALRQFFSAGTPRFVVGMAFLTLGSRIALCFVHASAAAAAAAATATAATATASISASLFGAPALGGLAGLAGGAYPLSLSDVVVAGIVAMIWLVHEWWIHDKLLHSEQEWMGTDIHGFHHLLPYVVLRTNHRPTTVRPPSRLPPPRRLTVRHRPARPRTPFWHRLTHSHLSSSHSYYHVSIDGPGLAVAWFTAAAAAAFVLCPNPALALTATFTYTVFGGVYEFCHYISHTRVPLKGYLKRVKQHHMQHHVVNDEYWLAFTLPSVDGLFGTLAEPKSVRRADPTAKRTGKRRSGPGGSD